MKKYIFTLIALSMIFTATARKPKNTRTTEAAAREIAAADSLRLVASRQAALIDPAQNLAARAGQRGGVVSRSARSCCPFYHRNVRQWVLRR